jgi:hypothetical protein
MINELQKINLSMVDLRENFEKCEEKLTEDNDKRVTQEKSIQFSPQRKLTSK